MCIAYRIKSAVEYSTWMKHTIKRLRQYNSNRIIINDTNTESVAVAAAASTQTHHTHNVYVYTHCFGHFPYEPFK